MKAFQTHLQLNLILQERETSTVDVAHFPNSLGIPRQQMPQIASGDVTDYLDWLKARGVSVRQEQARVADLKPTQKELNRDKVAGMTANAPESSLKKPIIAASDSYILDGHHRWAALVARDPNNRMPVWRVNIKIRDLLRITQDYPKVSYKEVHESAELVLV